MLCSVSHSVSFVLRSCAGARGKEQTRTTGRYEYTSDLLQLESYRPKCVPVVGVSLPAEFKVVKTLLQVQEWEEALHCHPDRKFIRFLLRDMTQGFQFGFDREGVTLESEKHNMHSAAEEPDVVWSYLQAERDVSRVLGPVPGKLDRRVAHVSRFGVIPKPHQPGKWRLIVDLSLPPQHSVNEGVHPKLSSLEYALTDQAASMVLHLGQGAELAKMDVASTYWIVPVPEVTPIGTRHMRQTGSATGVQEVAGPVTELMFLGITLDTQKLELRLPEEKMVRLGEAIGRWKRKKSCQKELLSQISQLQYATQIVKQGRAFLQCTYGGSGLFCGQTDTPYSVTVWF